MSWASRRRLLYFLGVLFVIVVAAAVPVARALYHAPTCSDGIQNEGETAPDLGGPCVALDPATLQSVSVEWARAFEVRQGEYGAIAYLLNPNHGAAVLAVPYTFSFYDANNVLVGERSGTTTIMAGATTPVYVGGISTGSRDIAHTFFKFTAPLSWVAATNPGAQLIVANTRAANTNAAPTITTDVTNTDVTDRDAITYVATAFDPAGNAIATSKTYVGQLAGGATKRLVFTWPDPFPVAPARIDVLPVIAPAVMAAR
ncbi:MAG TPA: hypothetical protein VFL98_01750 [Candidatus Paceibacterota bacterium]|nr:hypothetical protein [Candidatus Paceibacterota bacterium]